MDTIKNFHRNYLTIQCSNINKAIYKHIQRVGESKSCVSEFWAPINMFTHLHVIVEI